MKRLLTLMLISCSSISSAHAYFDVCDADILYDVRARDKPSSTKKKGTVWSGISGYQEDKKTRAGSFCEHGGYCYPSKIFHNNDMVEAIRLKNCSFGKANTNDRDTIYYELYPIRSKIPKKTLALYDVDRKLMEMGMSTAGSSGARDAYFKNPRSACGRMVRRVLQGDKAAARKIENGDVPCE